MTRGGCAHCFTGGSGPNSTIYLVLCLGVVFITGTLLYKDSLEDVQHTSTHAVIVLGILLQS